MLIIEPRFSILFLNTLNLPDLQAIESYENEMREKGFHEINI